MQYVLNAITIILLVLMLLLQIANFDIGSQTYENQKQMKETCDDTYKAQVEIYARLRGIPRCMSVEDTPEKFKKAQAGLTGVWNSYEGKFNLLECGPIE